jgi:hypothetical protein
MASLTEGNSFVSINDQPTLRTISTADPRSCQNAYRIHVSKIVIEMIINSERSRRELLPPININHRQCPSPSSHLGRRPRGWHLRQQSSPPTDCACEHTHSAWRVSSRSSTRRSRGSRSSHQHTNALSQYPCSTAPSVSAQRCQH